jgi:hypothetical protein
MKSTTIAIILIVILLAGTGCVSHVFNHPTTVSTKSIVYEHAKPIQKVSVDYSVYFFILIPIPADPRDVYDDLLAEAAAVGGNAVMDVQVRNSSFFMWLLPTVVVSTFEATGTAVKIE